MPNLASVAHAVAQAFGGAELEDGSRTDVQLQPKTKLYNHLGFLFSDFRIKLFVDPKPVEL